MPAPTPTSPTINDLIYASYNVGGSLNTTAFVPPLSIALAQVIFTNESFNPNLVGYTAKVDTSDFIATDKNVQVTLGATGPNLFSISGKSDKLATTEQVTVTAPFSPSTTKVVAASDTATTLDQPSITSPH